MRLGEIAADVAKKVKECLEQARDQQKKAIEWYDKAVGLAVAARGGTLSQRAVERIETRLETIDEFSIKGLGRGLLNLAMRAAHAKEERGAQDTPPPPKP